MRVAVNVEQLLSSSPGGIGRYTARLVGILADLGVEVQPVTALHRRSRVIAAWAEAGLQGKVRLPKIFWLPKPALYDAWHLLGWPPTSWDVDVVHAPSLAVLPSHGKPLVVSVHDAAPVLFPEAFTPRGRWFHAMGLRATAKRADLVITGSEAAAAELVEHTALRPERVRVVPYGVDRTGPDPQALERFGLDGVNYVLWVGSLEPRKGVGTLVAAMARLLKSNAALSGTSLVLAGYAGWQNASLLAKEDLAQLGPALRRLGRLSARELAALYSGAAVFAFPSLHEGFGLPVLEAMAAGAPVVASDIPSLREVSGGAAMLVPARDVEAWAEALEALLLRPALRAEMAEAGRQHASRFSWEATVAATLDVYREVAGL
ncbi:MAG: glycosyltransferase family 4 protein [Acidimicrobiales bacterium]